jgi:hypothetical protein
MVDTRRASQAAKHMDALRSCSTNGKSGVEIIRGWRDKLTRNAVLLGRT